MLNKIKDLTIEQMLIGVCFICLGLSIFAGNHYRSKANSLEITLGVKETELRIERDAAKISGNLKERLQLQDELAAMTKDYVELSGKYTALLGSDVSYTEIMNELGDLSSNEDICDAWAKLGYYICED